MDVNSYVDRIEASIENPDELERIREQAQADSGLSEREKEFVGERVGMYLADQQREQEAAAGEGFDPEAVDAGEE